MKYLFLFIMLAAGSLSLYAQPKANTQPAIPNAQIEALRTQIQNLQADVKEHRIREGFYSDVLGAHGTWCGILIALLGAGIGFVSWSKIKNAKVELKKEFDKAMKEHIEQDNIVRYNINKDRIELRRLAGNLCISSASLHFDQKRYNPGLFFAFDAIANGDCSKSFYDTLDVKCQNEMYEDENIKKCTNGTISRLEMIDEAIDAMLDMKYDIDADYLRKRWKEFDKLVLFFDETRTNEKIEHLRYNITYKLSPVFTIFSSEEENH